MYSHPRRKWVNKVGWRTVLVIGAGLLLGLALLWSAFPHRPVGEFSLPRKSVLNIGENLGFRILKGSPSGDPVVIASVPIPSDRNCTFTLEYWSKNPGRWPTDNLLVGQFTFSKENTLTQFLSDTQDLATRLQWQFIAAALNQLNGADPSAVEATMLQASAWIDANPPLIDLDTDERQEGEILAKNLEDYNRGLRGPGLCPEGLPLAFLAATPTQPLTEPAPELNVSLIPFVKATTVAEPENKRAQGSERRPRTRPQGAGSPAGDGPQPGPTPNPPVASAPAGPPQSQPLPNTGGAAQPVSAPEGPSQPAIASDPASQPASAPQPADTPQKERKQPKEPKPQEEPKPPKAAKPHEQPKPPKEPKPQEEPKPPKEAKPHEEPKPPKEPKPQEEPKPHEEPKPPKEPKPQEEPKPQKEPKQK